MSLGEKKKPPSLSFSHQQGCCLTWGAGWRERERGWSTTRQVEVRQATAWLRHICELLCDVLERLTVIIIIYDVVVLICDNYQKINCSLCGL